MIVLKRMFAIAALAIACTIGVGGIADASVEQYDLGNGYTGTVFPDGTVVVDFTDQYGNPASIVITPDGSNPYGSIEYVFT